MDSTRNAFWPTKANPTIRLLSSSFYDSNQSSSHVFLFLIPSSSQVAPSRTLRIMILFNWWPSRPWDPTLFAVFGHATGPPTLCLLILYLLRHLCPLQVRGFRYAQQHHPLPHCWQPGLEHDQWVALTHTHTHTHTHTQKHTHTEAETLLMPPNHGLTATEWDPHAKERQRLFVTSFREETHRRTTLLKTFVLTTVDDDDDEEEEEKIGSLCLCDCINRSAGAPVKTTSLWWKVAYIYIYIFIYIYIYIFIYIYIYIFIYKYVYMYVYI